jgi:hypothetical protein
MFVCLFISWSVPLILAISLKTVSGGFFL